MSTLCLATLGDLPVRSPLTQVTLGQLCSGIEPVVDQIVERLLPDGGDAEERIAQMVTEAFRRFDSDQSIEHLIEDAKQVESLPDIQVALTEALPDNFIPIQTLQSLSADEMQLFMQEILKRGDSALKQKFLKLLLVLMIYE